MTGNLPKAELHNHLEGTIAPDLVRRLATRNGITLPADLFDADDSYVWTDFLHFLNVYDAASAVIRTPEDYRDVTCAYLAACAAEGAIYVEVMSSPDHAAMAGMSYAAHCDGIVAGLEAARQDHGIEGRLIVTCVRHFGVERAIEVAKATKTYRHPLITGFGMGGDEAGYPPSDFERVFRIAHEEAGLSCTVHAGEWGGPDSVRAALALPVTRLGHGVRAIEDPALVELIAERGIVLEVCPSSNVATGLYASYADHPMPKLLAAGVAVTLNSDDPPYFHTSIGREYAVAGEHFGFDDDTLNAITRTAVGAAFVDAETKALLLNKIRARGTRAGF